MSRFLQYTFIMIATLLFSITVEAQSIGDSDRKDIEQAVFAEYGYYDAAEIEKRTRQWVLDQPMPGSSAPALSVQLCNRKCSPVTGEALSLLAGPSNVTIDGYNTGRNQFYPHLNISFSPPNSSGLAVSLNQMTHYLVRLASGNSHISTYLIPLLDQEPKDVRYDLKLRDLPADEYFVQVKAVYGSGSSNWTPATYFSVVDDTAQVFSLAPSEVYKCLRIHGYENKDFLKDVEQLSCNGLLADVQLGSVNLTDANAATLSRLYGLRQLNISFMTQLNSIQALNAQFLPHLSWLNVRGGATASDGLEDIRTLDTVILQNSQLTTIPTLPPQASYIDMSASAVTSGAQQFKGYPRKVVKLNDNPLSDAFFTPITFSPLAADQNAANIEILDIAGTTITHIDNFASIQNLSHININDTLVGSGSNVVDIDLFTQGLCGLQMDNTNARFLQGFRPIQFLSIKNNPALYKVKTMNNAGGSNGDRDSYFLPNYLDLSGSNSMQCQHMYNLHDRWDNLAHVNLDGSNGLSCPDYSNSDVFNRPTDCSPNRLFSVDVYEGTATKRRYITWQAKPEHEREYDRWGVTQYEISELSETGIVLDVHYVAVDEPQPFTVYSNKAAIYSIKVCTENQCGDAKQGTVSYTGLSQVEDLMVEWDAAAENFVLQFNYPQAVFDTPFGKPEYFKIDPLFTQLPGTPEIPVISVGATNQTPWTSVSVSAQQYLGNSFEVSACRQDLGCGAATQIVVIQPGTGNGELPVPQWSSNGVSVTDHTRIELNWNWGGQSTQDVDYVEIVETQPIFKIDALVTDPSNFGHKEIKYFIDKIDQPLVLNRPSRGTYEFRLRACERNRDSADTCSELSPEYNVSAPDAEITRDEVTIDPDTGPELIASNDTGTLKKPKSMELVYQGNSKWYLRWRMHPAHFNSTGLKPDYFQLKSLSSGSSCRLPDYSRIREFKVNYGDGHHNLPEWFSYKMCDYIFSQSTRWTVQSCVNGAGCTLPVMIGEEPNINVVEPVPVEETLESTDGPGSLNPGAWWHPELSGIGWQFFWANQAAETDRVMYGNTYDLIAYWYTYAQVGKQWTPVWFEAKLKRADNENFYEGFLQFHDRRSGQLEEVNVGTLKVFTNLGAGDNRYIDLNINLTEDSILTQIGGIDLGPYEPVNPNDDSGELKIRLNDIAIEIIGPTNDGNVSVGRFGRGNDADHYSGIWQTQQDSDADPVLNMGTWIERGLEFTTISTHDSQGLPIWFNAQTCDGDSCNRPGAGFFDNYITGNNGYSLSWVMEGFYPLGAKPINYNLGNKIRTVGEMARCFARPDDFRQSKAWVSINDILSDNAGYNRGINLNFGGNRPTSCASWPGSTGDMYKKASFHGVLFDVVQNSEVLAGNTCDPDDGVCLLTISWYTDDDFPAIEPKFSIDGSDYLPLNSIEGCENLPTVDPFITREFECEMTVSGSYQFQLHKPSYNNLQTNSIAIAESEILTIAECNNPDCQSTLDLSSEPPSTEALPTLEAGHDTVGYTSGQFNVDQTGQANYSIPIFAGQGTAGVAPQIGINYSSSAGNGHLGVGWSVSGISMITRCPETQEARDGNTVIMQKPIQWNNEDRFCLNGERLFSVLGSYGEDGTEYRTERDQIARIISHGGDGNNPSYFTVERKDGSISFYGLTANSNVQADTDGDGTLDVTHSWNINRYQDNVSNYIDYVYELLPNLEFVLKEINYTGNENQGMLPYNAIKFVYNDDAEPRPDVYESYFGGVKVAVSKRLEKIESLIDGTTVREYTLNYEESITSSRSLLRSIQECRDTHCLPETTFEWSEPDRKYQSSNASIGGDFPTRIKSSKFGDINGDGRPDLVFVNNSNQFKVAYADTNQGLAVGTNTNIPAPIADDDEIDNKWHLIDYNADGRQDLMRSIAGFWVVYPARSLQDGGGISPVYDSTEVPAIDGSDFQVTDVNGDGLADLLYPPSGANAQLSVRFLERTASGYAFSGKLVPIDLPSAPEDLVEVTPPVIQPGERVTVEYRFKQDKSVNFTTQDVNGDGIADLLLSVDIRVSSFNTSESSDGYKFVSAGTESTRGGVEPSRIDSSHWIAFVSNGLNKDGALDYVSEQYYIDSASTSGSLVERSKKIRFVDINNDGMSDVLAADTGITWKYKLATGKGFTEFSEAGSVLNEEHIQISDYNGDGYFDILFPNNLPQQNYSVRSWNGQSFNLITENSQAFARDIETNFNLFIDINGDGRSDHFRVGTDGVIYMHHQPEVYQPVDRITGITNGLGAATNMLYRPLTFSTTYTQGGHDTNQLYYGNGSPVFDLMGSMYVVREIMMDAPSIDSFDDQTHMRYHYKNARVQTGGRGFLGFEEIITFTPVKDTLNDSVYRTLRSQVTYAQEFPYIGLATSTQMMMTELDFYGTIPGVCSGNDCFPPPCEPGEIGCDQLQRGTVDSNLLLSKTINSLDYTVHEGNSKVYFPYVETTTESTYSPESPDALNPILLKSTSQTTQYDDYGNPILNTVVIKNGSGQTIQTNSSVKQFCNLAEVNINVCGATASANEGLWYNGLLERDTSTVNRMGEASVSTVMEYDYDYASGLMSEERHHPNQSDELFLRTVHEYDVFGNERLTINCSGDVVDCNRSGQSSTEGDPLRIHRFTELNYDVQGRYVNSATNALGHMISSVSKRDVYGSPTVSQDLVGRTTINTYDMFGRLTSSRNLATGEWSQVSRQWCANIPQGQNVTACPSDRNLSIRIRSLESGGSVGYTYMDKLSREVVNIAQTFNSTDSAIINGDERWVGSQVWFDRLGRQVIQEGPYFIGDSNTSERPTTVTEFDRYNRPIQVNVAGTDQNLIEGMSYDGFSTSYYNGLNQRKIETVNVLGQLVEVQDFDQVGSQPNYQNTLSYQYNSLGLIRKIDRTVTENNALVTETLSTAVYDIAGRKIESTDMDTGYGSSVYNALSEIVSVTDSKQQVLSTFRDSAGRTTKVTSELDSGGLPQLLTQTTFTFDSYNGTDIDGMLLHEQRISYEGPSMISFEKEHAYDSYFRPETSLIRFTDTDNVCSAGLCEYEVGVYFDKYSRVKYQLDASGKAIQNHYDGRGYISHITKADNPEKEYYRVLSTDKWGNINTDQKGASSLMTTGYIYDPLRGWLTDIASAHQQYRYEYDVIGNLKSRRQDAILSTDNDHLECFAYDRLNRLTVSKRYATNSAGTSNCDTTQGVMEQLVTSYDGRGNLTLKDGLTYQYYGVNQTTTGFSPHQVRQKGNQEFKYDAKGNNTSMTNFVDADGEFVTRNINYTAFDKIKRIWTVNSSNETRESEYRYDTSEDRYYRKDTENNNSAVVTHFIGNVEIAYEGSGPAIFKRQLGNYAIIKEEGPSTQIQYVFTDHLGSLDLITDENAEVIQRMSFSAWGERRNALDHNTIMQSTQRIFDSPYTTKGFTGHEMLDVFGIINMGGRIYDASLGRVLQADPFVQEPGNSQSYNRYTYAFNNPLSFTDPSGYISLKQVAALAIGIVLSLALGPAGMQVANAFWAGFWGGFVSSYIITGNLRAALKSGLISGSISYLDSKFIGDKGGSAADPDAPITDGVDDIIEKNAYTGALPEITGTSTGAVESGLASATSEVAETTVEAASNTAATSVAEEVLDLGTIQVIGEPITMRELALDAILSNSTAQIEFDLYEARKAASNIEYDFVSRAKFAHSAVQLNELLNDLGVFYNVSGKIITAIDYATMFSPVGALKTVAKKGLTKFFKGGKTFSQFKREYWKHRTKPKLDPIINPKTGDVWKQYAELHHRFIPQRANVPLWLKNNRFNIKELTSLKHAMVDPFRARFAPKWVKELYNLKWK
ncbi:RHS repeat-associated core domain-containing protein [Marinicella sp. W31]|uniref:RHS repeat-associated core domain-containing protein n=1 Tax=Marinicella sp. W31 TaxID=3023713 RepID=UPI003757DB4E